jgi:hypothetical protein
LSFDGPKAFSQASRFSGLAKKEGMEFFGISVDILGFQFSSQAFSYIEIFAPPISFTSILPS